MRLDSGGALYHLPAESFKSEVKKGLGRDEWISKVPVRPLGKEVVKSGLSEMIRSGVKVYFVSRRTFRKIKKSEDDGLSIVERLSPEALHP